MYENDYYDRYDNHRYGQRYNDPYETDYRYRYNQRYFNRRTEEQHTNKNNVTIDKMIREHGVDKTFKMLFGWGKVDLLRTMIEYGKRPTTDEAMIWAAEDIYADIFKVFLDDGDLDPCVNNNFLIALAADLNQPKIVKLLLDDGRVDSHAYNDYAIHVARHRVKQLLLDY